ncbi:hypothetical protein D3C75_814890 [compost metagenome]
MPRDTVLTDHVDKIPLGVACERRFAKMRVLAEISCRFDIKVSKVAATSARHQNLTAWFFTVIDE